MKIKLTKTELKTQKDALARFKRYLPMLQLKKQQLQSEIAHINAHIEEVNAQRSTTENAMQKWVHLLADPNYDGAPLCTLTAIHTEPGNIAGVKIPLFKSATIEAPAQDPWLTPAWVDDAQREFSLLLKLRAEIGVLETQRELVSEELRITSQRVNLFEKVKIPECRENIRVITIALGDEQTAGVVRGKIAKGRHNNGEAA